MTGGQGLEERWSSPRRGLLVGVGGLLLVALVLEPFREHLARATPAPIVLVPVILAALIGGRRVGLAVAALASLVYWFEFIPPLGSLHLKSGADRIALVLIITICVTMALLMGWVGERLRSTIAERNRLEVENRRVAVLELAELQRASLLRAVSHDLRTPLATIRAAATELAAPDVDFDEGTRRELVALVGLEAERLDRIVANLLNLARVEAGAIMPDRRPIALADLVASCLARHARLVEGGSISVDLPPDLPLVEVDAVQIDQVLTNLLENSIRHGEGAHVTVSAVASPGTVTVGVADAGPGVAPQLRPTLFTPFQHLGGSGGATRNHKGVGMGLAVCQAIVQAHGGTLTLDDGHRDGARFTFTIPTADTA